MSRSYEQSVNHAGVLFILCMFILAVLHQHEVVLHKHEIKPMHYQCAHLGRVTAVVLHQHEVTTNVLVSTKNGHLASCEI